MHGNWAAVKIQKSRRVNNSTICVNNPRSTKKTRPATIRLSRQDGVAICELRYVCQQWSPNMQFDLMMSKSHVKLSHKKPSKSKEEYNKLVADL